MKDQRLTLGDIPVSPDDPGVRRQRCRVVGWAVSDRMKKDLAIRALDMAMLLRSPLEGCIFHSDRGSQYCSYDYQKKLPAYGLQPSMSCKGNCYVCDKPVRLGGLTRATIDFVSLH